MSAVHLDNDDNNHGDYDEIEQMLREAEALAARMRSTTTAGSLDSSSLSPNSEIEPSQSFEEKRASDPSHQSIVPSVSFSDSKSVATPQSSQSTREEVEAVIRSSLQMELALHALNQSQTALETEQRDASTHGVSNVKSAHSSSDEDDDQGGRCGSPAVVSQMMEASSMMNGSNGASIVWEKVELVQEADEDYVSVADYGPPGKKSVKAKSSQKATKKLANVVHDMTEAAQSSKYIEQGTSSGITWHKLDAPSEDDEDYVPLADYSKKTASFTNTSLSYDPTATHLSRQELFRRKTALQRKKRKKYILRSLVVLLFLIGIFFVCGFFLASSDKDEVAQAQQDETEQTELKGMHAHESHERLSQEEDDIEMYPLSVSGQQERNTNLPEVNESMEPTPNQKSAENHILEESPQVPDEQDRVLTHHDREPATDVKANGDKDGPCDTRLAPGASVTNKTGDGEKAKTYWTTNTNPPALQQNVEGDACQMAFAKWLLPVCRHQQAIHSETPSSSSDTPSKGDQIMALVQAMMQ
jgi:hypothetical protein